MVQSARRPSSLITAPRRWLAAGAALVAHQVAAEWRGSPFHLMSLRGRRPDGLAAAPHDLRPADRARGESILGGRWTFAGESMTVGPGGDPWDRPNPSRTFAQLLQGMGWLGDLVAHGERGEREALRLLLDWRRVFGRWNAFAWSPGVLERRVFNLACHLKPICARASEAETALLAEALARQARHLLALRASETRAAERTVAAALAGLALGGGAGAALSGRALARLGPVLQRSVLPDGGHASRSPQAGLDLLLDLLALDDGLSQRGRAGPDELPRAIDRLAAALRLLTLPDGRLACFQGGEPGRPADIVAARNACDLEDPPARPAAWLSHAGYQRLNGRGLTVMVDAAPPAQGGMADAACAQPLAIEVLAGAERLITNCGWSPLANGSPAYRLTGAGSTSTIKDGSVGAPLIGVWAHARGARLIHDVHQVEREIQESPEAVWLDLAHDGWAPRFGLRCERALYLDLRQDELRGEDRVVAIPGAGERAPAVWMTVHFHLAPHVRASMARDGRSVLLQGKAAAGWWLRNDAGEVSIEGSVCFDGGEPLRSSQVILRSRLVAGAGGRIRWKLAPVAS